MWPVAVPNVCRRLQSSKTDVVLLDISMPDISGYELARQIRSRPQNASLAILALSAYADPEHAELSLAAGCDDHLAKPAARLRSQSPWPARSSVDATWPHTPVRPAGRSDTLHPHPAAPQFFQLLFFLEPQASSLKPSLSPALAPATGLVLPVAKRPRF